VLTVYSNGWASSVQHAIFWRKPPNVRGHRPPGMREGGHGNDLRCDRPSGLQHLTRSAWPGRHLLPLPLPCWFSHCHLRRTIGSTEQIAIVEDRDHSTSSSTDYSERGFSDHSALGHGMVVSTDVGLVRPIGRPGGAMSA